MRNRSIAEFSIRRGSATRANRLTQVAQSACALHRHQSRQIGHELAKLSPAILNAMSAIKTLKIAIRSRMWILPEGSVQPATAWNSQWLQPNKAVAGKFQIPLAVLRSNDSGGRKIALQRGFVCVGYQSISRRLWIEGLRRCWTPKVKDAVFVLIMKHAHKIDNVCVRMFDDGVKRVMAKAEASFVGYGAQEKLAQIPFVSESPRGRALQIIARRCWRNKRNFPKLPQGGPGQNRLYGGPT